MFMVSLVLSSEPECAADFRNVASIPTQLLDAGVCVGVKRAAAVRYDWLPFRLAKKIAFAGLYLTGLWEQTATVRVALHTNLFDNSSAPILFAGVSLTDAAIQVYSARLVAVAHMTGLTYVMYHWFLSSCLVAVNALTVWYLVVFYAAFGLYASAHVRTGQPRSYDPLTVWQWDEFFPPDPVPAAPPPPVHGPQSPIEQFLQRRPDEESVLHYLSMVDADTDFQRLSPSPPRL